MKAQGDDRLRRPAEVLSPAARCNFRDMRDTTSTDIPARVAVAVLALRTSELQGTSTEQWAVQSRG